MSWSIASSERGRCLSPRTVECATLAAADRIRVEYGDCVIRRDDAREKTVWYSGDAPRQARRTIERIAYRSQQRAEAGFGQTPLTRFERGRIDFERTNIFHARACKAIAVEFGVEDWLARYDWTLTVSEHVEIYRRASGTTARGEPTLREMAARSL
jgi:hypothetical protein